MRPTLAVQNGRPRLGGRCLHGARSGQQQFWLDELLPAASRVNHLPDSFTAPVKRHVCAQWLTIRNTSSARTGCPLLHRADEVTDVSRCRTNILLRGRVGPHSLEDGHQPCRANGQAVNWSGRDLECQDVEAMTQVPARGRSSHSRSSDCLRALEFALPHFPEHVSTGGVEVLERNSVGLLRRGRGRGIRQVAGPRSPTRRARARGRQ
jgi:hypothetical protein